MRFTRKQTQKLIFRAARLVHCVASIGKYKKFGYIYTNSVYMGTKNELQTVFTTMQEMVEKYINSQQQYSTESCKVVPLFSINGIQIGFQFSTDDHGVTEK